MGTDSRGTTPLIVAGLALAALVWALWGLWPAPDTPAEPPPETPPAAAEPHATGPNRRRARRSAKSEPPADETSTPPATPAAVRTDNPEYAPDEFHDELKRVIELHRPPGLAFKGFTAFLLGRYRRIDSLDSGLTSLGRSYALDGSVVGKYDKETRYRGLRIGGDVRPGAELELDSQRGLVIGGDMAGALVCTGQQFVRIEGDLTGEIRAKGQIHVEVLGDVTGTVKSSSQASFTVHGDITGTVDVNQLIGALLGGTVSGTLKWNSLAGPFYWRQPAEAWEIERLTSSRGGTLHLEQGPMPKGRHADVAGWDEVIVGDPVWDEF